MITITKRDERLFIKLNEASWLRTGQIGRYFFPDKAANAVNKRMRKLTGEGYLYPDRRNSTEDYLYRLTNKSKQHLILNTSIEPEDIIIPKRLPQNLKHFIGINDLRSFIEMSVKNQSGEMLLFAMDREIKQVVPQAIIIPDAIARLRIPVNGTNNIYNLILEYDNETENADYFARYKVKKYVQLLQNDGSLYGLHPIRILIFANSMKRIKSLMKASIKIIIRKDIFYFSTLDHLDRNDFLKRSNFIDPYSHAPNL